MSDHPEVPRVTFNDDGYSMNVEDAVAAFRRLLRQTATDMAKAGFDNWGFTLEIEIRSCDCGDDIRGRDSGCPLHGDGYPDGEAKYPLPEWCSTNACEDPRCHRCFPRSECRKHEKCRDAS